ncbi:uncharacterized protein BXIN_1486 [Babesia sp. Xinjiang]|uniref:uncharacterized protein n=1 Tax=Babesia sp. Xinjiang TaxID=462227 RepID=UPI000A24C506|nr:uncharacterized protein BXIN_1486 [Babesia sp. Xinjiang]ORM42261.1 hypothetical protein BXIN_1486 [Babesia sp. Xinjiang]
MRLQKELNGEDQNARVELHKLVDDATPSVMMDIRGISDVVDEVIEHIFSSMGNVTNSGYMLTSFHLGDEAMCDDDTLNSMADLCHQIEQVNDREKIPLLIAYEVLLNDISEVKKSAVIQILKDKVAIVKKNLEQELYKSFNNNINVTLKTFAEIRMLGMSTDEEIASGFINNRKKYIAERLNTVQMLLSENRQR